MITILLVDDQNLVQQGIKSLLEQEMELKVIGTVKDGKSALEAITRTKPDIVLLDIEMPGMNGITTTKYINRISPETKVIILSTHEDKKYVTQALLAGAKGYLLKSSLMTDLKQAIIAVDNGYSQIESRLLAKVFDPTNLKSKTKKTTTPSSPSGKAPQNHHRSPAKVSAAAKSKNTSERSGAVVAPIETITTPDTSTAETVVNQKIDTVTTSNSLASTNSTNSNLLEAEIVTENTEDLKSDLLKPENITVSLPNSEDSLELQTVSSQASYPNRFDYYSNGKNASALTKRVLFASRTNKTSSPKLQFQASKFTQQLKSQLSLISDLAKQSDRSWVQKFKSIYLRLKHQLGASIQHKQQRDLIWNLGLIVLGVMIVIILSNL